MGLSRIKNAEQLREHAPGEFGKLLGLDRVPEVRCLRSKVNGLSEQESVERWAAALSQQWMESDPEAAGTLYIDGHVRVYHGHLTKLPKRQINGVRVDLINIHCYLQHQGPAEQEISAMARLKRVSLIGVPEHVIQRGNQGVRSRCDKQSLSFLTR